ncbi:MAG: RraA family protein [Proteobacteria bacterium]|nr:MAG: RraA family protein [Pseudomonadota bacterium]
MDIQQLLQRLAHVDPAAVADMDQQIRVMSSDIRPVRAGLRLLGRAYTVRCFEDYLVVLAALEETKAGEVMVIDTQGSSAAVVGELFSMEAARRGLSGIVIDGACRDVATIRTLDMPVYARAFTPRSGTSVALGERQTRVCCGGVEVCPGDIIFGDDDGIVVGSEVEFAQLLAGAEAIKRTEHQVHAALAAGTSLVSMLNFAEHHAHIEAGDTSSKLKFLL